MYFIGLFGAGPEDQYRALSIPEAPMAAMSIKGIAVLEVSLDGQTRLVSPAETLGLIAIGAEGTRQARAFLSDWASRIGGPQPDLCEFPELNADTANRAVAWIAGQLAGRLRQFATNNQALRRQISALRLDYE